MRRYLLGAVQDPDTADDLFQEFAYRFLHGDYRGASPERGRFRNYLKGVISHLVADFCNRRKRQMPGLSDDVAEPAVSSSSDDDRLFLGELARRVARQDMGEPGRDRGADRSGLSHRASLSGRPSDSAFAGIGRRGG